MGDNRNYTAVATQPPPIKNETTDTPPPVSNGIARPNSLFQNDNNQQEIGCRCIQEEDTCESPIERNRPHSYKKHQSRTFTYLDASFILKGIGTYIFDVVTDILACIKYFSKGDYWWAILTMVFILIASVTVQISSFRWFVDDYADKRARKPGRGFFRKLFDVVLSIIVHVLQLGTLNRYLRCLYFGWKSRESDYSHKKYYIWKVYEQRDLTMLRLIEAFMEAGPQLVLQIYIMLQLYTMAQLPQFYWITALSALSSLISLSWALEAYHKALRESLEDKIDIDYCGFALRFVWRICMISSRVTAMALFALHFQWWIFPVMFVHWVAMAAWLIWQKTEFYDTRREEIPFVCVIAVVHIFCFFNMKEGRTRMRASLYYILIFFENSAMVILWYCYSGMYIVHSHGIVALSFVLAGFFAGILTMSIYYVCFHPNRLRQERAPDMYAQQQQDLPGDVPDSGPCPEGMRHGVKRCNLFRSEGRRYCWWEEASQGSDTAKRTNNVDDVDSKQNSTTFESSV